MLGFLGSLFSSVFSGGITGLLGVGLQRFADYKNKQLDIQNAKNQLDLTLAVKKADAELVTQQLVAQQNIASTQVSGQVAQADAASVSASYALEPKKYSDAAPVSPAQEWLFVLLDFFRGVIRPFLTLYLCAITTIIYLRSSALLQGGLPAADALDLVKQIVCTVLYLTTTCVLWWFGTRNKQPQPGEKK